jgi:hypothetical protein
MSSSPVRHEHRAAQRFPVQLPVTLYLGDDVKTIGITQDVSARGAFILTEHKVTPSAAVAFTVTLPREVTLTESMRVRCQGKVLRVDGPGPGGKFGVAISIGKYEFLPEVANQARPAAGAALEAEDSKFGPQHSFRAYPPRS